MADKDILDIWQNIQKNMEILDKLSKEELEKFWKNVFRIEDEK